MTNSLRFVHVYKLFNTSSAEVIERPIDISSVSLDTTGAKIIIDQ